MPLPPVATALKGVEGEDAAPDAEASTVAERTNAIIAAAEDTRRYKGSSMAIALRLPARAHTCQRST